MNTEQYEKIVSLINKMRLKAEVEQREFNIVVLNPSLVSDIIQYVNTQLKGSDMKAGISICGLIIVEREYQKYENMTLMRSIDLHEYDKTMRLNLPILHPPN